MRSEQKDYINSYLWRKIRILIPDGFESVNVAASLADEVIQDVEECAGPENWHSGDIDVAISRVLAKRLLGKEAEK